MKVKELIEKLEALQMPDARVVTPGFDESGFDDVAAPEIIEVVFHDEYLGHGGRHEEASQATDKSQSERAVLMNFD